MLGPDPIRLMIIGVLLMIAGVVLPLLMVLGIVESTFLLAFISYGASLIGMFLAFIGLFSYVRFRRK
jgi:hypothetical protein